MRAWRKPTNEKTVLVENTVPTPPVPLAAVFPASNPVTTFLALTQTTCPYGEEWSKYNDVMEALGADMDSHGNYYLRIGEPEQSATIFAAHLDTANYLSGPVKHNIVIGKGKRLLAQTDGKTILGADDAAGVTVLLYLIHHNVPGLYYFFVGEEKGRLGSHGAALDERQLLMGHNRVICWDRCGTTSIITHQMMERSCSDVFANDLAARYEMAGVELTLDDGGTYTDSYSLFSLVPECTNISIGYENAHSVSEVQDLDFLKRMCEASLNIAWESLPTVQDCNDRPMEGGSWYTGSYGYYTGSYGYTGRISDRRAWSVSDDDYDFTDVLELAANGALTEKEAYEFCWNHPAEAAEFILMLSEDYYGYTGRTRVEPSHAKARATSAPSDVDFLWEGEEG